MYIFIYIYFPRLFLRNRFVQEEKESTRLLDKAQTWPGAFFFFFVVFLLCQKLCSLGCPQI